MTTKKNPIKKDERIGITNGPSRTHLLQAFECAYDGRLENTVRFRFVHTATYQSSDREGEMVTLQEGWVDARIIGLKYEGYSGVLFTVEALLSPDPISGESEGLRTLSYNATGRKGVISLI